MEENIGAPLRRPRPLELAQRAHAVRINAVRHGAHAALSSQACVVGICRSRDRDALWSGLEEELRSFIPAVDTYIAQQTIELSPLGDVDGDGYADFTLTSRFVYQDVRQRHPLT